MAKVLTRCPLCEGSLHVSELACRNCGSSIRSSFDTCRFCRLAPEHLTFVELFLRHEGNVSRVCAELGLSYPTVRNKLLSALAALGFDEAEKANESNRGAQLSASIVTSDANKQELSSLSPEMLERRRKVLESLALGTISAEEAADILRDS